MATGAPKTEPLSRDANPKSGEFYSVEAPVNDLRRSYRTCRTLQEMAVPTFLLRKAGVQISDRCLDLEVEPRQNLVKRADRVEHAAVSS